MEHGTKDPRVRGYAKTYGVPIEKLIALEKRLLGQTKHFRPGTLKKYQAEMEKLEAEQKKRRDELLDKGNEILAALGKE